MALPPPVQRPTSRTKRRILAVTSLGLAGFLAGLLSGCGTGIAPAAASTTSFAKASGNWQFSSTSAAAAHLSSLGGSLTVNGSSVTGTLHPLSLTNQCVDASTAIPVTGKIDAENHLSLSSPLNGGTLTIAGTLSEDLRSLSFATYTVTGGSCAFASTRQSVSARDSGTPITGQQYTPVNGTYTGTITTAEGEQFPITSTLAETSQPDADGIYHVTGTAASPGNSCIPGSLPATASTIEGGSISTTYTDATNGTTITGTGSSSPDGRTITVTNWTITSVCGSDTGSGTLNLQ